MGAGGGLALELVSGGEGGVWEAAAWPNRDPGSRVDDWPGADGARASDGKKQRKRARTEQLPPDHAYGAEQHDDRALRSRALCAWLIPLLVGSVVDLEGDARRELRRWLERVGHDEADRARPGLPLSLEMALAQGFKYAANRRSSHPNTSAEARVFLAEQATDMLGKARFWFTQLTLIQALCLAEIAEPDNQRGDRPPATPGGRNRGRSKATGHGSNPDAIVGRWLELARSRDQPFVAEAGKLAVRALQTRRPQRFLWIDESGVVAK